MLDSIRPLPDATGAGPLIRQEDRRAARERRLLLDQARQQASRLIAEAQAQAEQIRLHALEQGHGHGLMQAAGEIAQALLMENSMAARLRADVALQAEQLLTRLLGSQAWVETLVQDWLADCAADLKGQLHVIVPTGRAAAMRHCLEQQWLGTLHIECGEPARFLFRHGDQVLEFDLPAVVAPLVPPLLLQVRALQPAMQGLDEASAAHLQTWVEGVVSDVAARAQENEHAD